MNVSLTPELNNWINEKVKTGLYHSSSEVIREGLRLLIRHEEQKSAMVTDLRAELLIGVKQLDSKKSKLFDKELIDRIKKDSRKELGL